MTWYFRSYFVLIQFIVLICTSANLIQGIQRHFFDKQPIDYVVFIFLDKSS